MKVEVDEYMDIERRETVKAEARKLRKQFLRYKEAEIVYSIQHKKLLELDILIQREPFEKELLEGIYELVLIVPISIMVHGERNYEYGLVPAIAMAAYTTYRIVIAIINLKKAKRQSNCLILR